MQRAILRTTLLSLCMAGVSWGLGAPEVLAQTRQELELPSELKPTVGFDIQVEQNSGLRPNCPFEGQAITINLTEVSFLKSNGSTISPETAETLAGVNIPTGTQPLSVICDIRDEANQALRRDGWIATVQIPQQELQGALRLNVISARLSEVRIIGNSGPYRSLLEERLQSLQKLDPLNEKDAERILLGIADVPGMELRMALAPSGGSPGEVIGNLTVSYEPYAVFLNARNYNSKRIGRETAYGRFEYYGLTGLADMTYVGAQTTFDFEEQFIAQLGHEFGFGKRGIRVGGDITLARSNPDLENLDLQTDALLVNLRAKYPLFRTSQASADVTLGFDYVDQATDVGEFPLSEDSIRSLYLRGGITGIRRAPGAPVAFGYDAFLELRQGLNVFGATEIGANGTAVTDNVSASRPFGRGDSLIARGGLDLTSSFGSIFGAKARGEVQWTDNPLLNYDEYSIGNLSIGRGYDPGANSGDRAIGGAFEVSANIITGSRPSVQTFGFYDVVQVENLDFGTPDPKRTLASAGGGIRVGLGDGVRAEIIYAKPLDRAIFSDEEKPSDRLMFSITTKFPASFR